MTKNNAPCSTTINDEGDCAVVCEEDDDQWTDVDDDTRDERLPESDKDITFSRVDPKLLSHGNRSVLTAKLQQTSTTSFPRSLTRIDSDDDVRTMLINEMGDQEKLSLSRERREKSSSIENKVKQGCWRINHWKFVQVKVQTDDSIYNIDDYHTRGW